jgi:hypothetical protein
MTDANQGETRTPRSAKPIDMSPKAIEERWNILWQLTVEEWAKKGTDITKLPMQKDVVRLTRLKDQ